MDSVSVRAKMTLDSEALYLRAQKLLARCLELEKVISVKGLTKAYEEDGLIFFARRGEDENGCLLADYGDWIDFEIDKKLIYRITGIRKKSSQLDDIESILDATEKEVAAYLAE